MTKEYSTLKELYKSSHSRDFIVGNEKGSIVEMKRSVYCNCLLWLDQAIGPLARQTMSPEKDLAEHLSVL